MKKYMQILKKCPLFSDIGEDSLIKMLSCLGARVLKFEKTFTVFAEGSSAKYIGIVLSGEVQVTNLDYYGNRSIISVMGPSQIFGESFACAELKAIPVSVVASEDSEIMLIDSSHIIHTCQNNCGHHQQLIFNLMRDLAEKSLSFHQKIGDAAGVPDRMSSQGHSPFCSLP